MKNWRNGIDCAASILEGPDLSEHRRKELALARLMAVSIGVILNTVETDLDTRIEKIALLPVPMG